MRTSLWPPFEYDCWPKWLTTFPPDSVALLYPVVDAATNGRFPEDNKCSKNDACLLLQSHVPILLSTFTLNLPTDELINYAATAREMTIFQPFPLSISSNSLIMTPFGDYLDQSTQLFFATQFPAFHPKKPVGLENYTSFKKAMDF